MNQSSLQLYSFLSRFSPLKSYKGKIMLVAFLGTHVPLLTLLFYFVISNSLTLAMTVRVLAIALLATLAGTGATLYALHYLLIPVLLTSATLQKYLAQNILPSLPTQFGDEAGSLMANTSRTLQKLDEAIHHMANYDDLTGLPNRDLFRERLRLALSEAKEDVHHLVIIALDLDRFHEINNALGRSTGDLLLREVVQRLTTCMEETDVLSRFGNDEFVMLRTNLTTLDSASALSQELIDTIAQPYQLNGKTVHTSASAGITIYPFDGTSVEQLLQNADAALNQAKGQQRNTYQFYSSDRNSKLHKRLALEEELRHALRREEMFLRYQPRVDLETGNTIAVEALLRWRSPEWGLVSPGKFIPIAEESGLIIPIGEWVLRTACAQNQAWQKAGFPPLRVSVNLSACQFKQKNLIEMVDQVLTETGLDSSYLELEVTESLIVEDVEEAIAILGQLHQRGITLSLDDFGTGYSSMNYLQQFPINTLKIDRSFVSHVGSNPNNAAITRAIIALARSLQLNITAEGVETQEQLNYLENHGCDEVQGYYFSGALSPDALTTFICRSTNYVDVEMERRH